MKRKNFLASLMAFAVVAMTITACDKDDDNDPIVKGEADLFGDITVTMNLDANTVYTLTGPLLVKNNGVLNIPAGTRIEAEEGAGSYILVEQGGKINVNGTAAAPVVMTSDVENGGPGYWGGLVINGKAGLTDGAQGSTEILAEIPYGGNDDNDDSGKINYLVLEYTGAAVNDKVEHNGLTLNGVGNGTEISNVYVKDGGDDGIEFFGGSVDVSNLLVVNSDDDMFDFTYGYNGTLSNAYGIWMAGYQTEEGDPNGVEADGNLDGLNATGARQADFMIENMTIDLKLDYAPKAESGAKKYMLTALMIRRGATATIENALIKGTGHVATLIDFSNSAGNGNTATSIDLTNALTVPSTGTNPDVVQNPADGFPDVTVAAGNTGCSTSHFNWIQNAGYALPF